MTLPISLRPLRGAEPASGETAPRGLGVKLPIKIGLPFGGTASSGAPAQVVAIATAAAMNDPADALALARLAREKPEEALTKEFSADKVEEVVAAVRQAQQDPSQKIDPSSDQKETAAAVGANARLVGAAAALIPPKPADAALAGPDSHGASARRWIVALGKGDLLDRAARAAIQASANDPLEVDRDVRTLQKKVTDLEATIADIKQKNAELAAKVDKIADLEREVYRIKTVGRKGEGSS